MKIAVTSQGKDLDAQVDPRFGRCATFVIVDTETMEFEAVPNDNINASGGAGIQSAQVVAGQDAEVVLTGNCGPNAFKTLQAADIGVIIGVKGSVRDAVTQFKDGTLSVSKDANVANHFGTSGS